ncbi:MAG TPA: hypothetical protein VGL91_25390 [Acidobacteriota bacterium]|jgi:hypothetical protein
MAILLGMSDEIAATGATRAISSVFLPHNRPIPEKAVNRLGIPTKSGLIRAALNAWEEKTEQERLRRDIHESVRPCATADREENRELFPAGVARRT